MAIKMEQEKFMNICNIIIKNIYIRFYNQQNN